MKYVVSVSVSGEINIGISIFIPKLGGLVVTSVIECLVERTLKNVINLDMLKLSHIPVRFV